MSIVQKIKEFKREENILKLIESKLYNEIEKKVSKANGATYNKIANTILRTEILEILSKHYYELEEDITIDEIINLLFCASPSYIPILLDDLVADKVFPNKHIDTILKNLKVAEALNGKKEKYIKAFMDSTSNIGKIIDLYNSRTTTESERKFIEENTRIWITKNPGALVSLILGKKFALKIFNIAELENMVINSKNSNAYEYLLQYPESNKNRLLVELGKIKDESAANKKVFLNTISNYTPEVLNKVSYGSYVREVYSTKGLGPLDRAKIFENAYYGLEKLDSKVSEDDEKLNIPSYSDEEKTVIEELEPPMPSVSDYGKPPKAYKRKSKPIKVDEKGRANHF